VRGAVAIASILSCDRARNASTAGSTCSARASWNGTGTVIDNRGFADMQCVSLPAAAVRDRTAKTPPPRL
jgi:hypothetical protein